MATRLVTAGVHARLSLRRRAWSGAPPVRWGRMVGVIAVIGGAWVALSAARPFVAGLSLVMRAADVHGLARGAADLWTVPIRERTVALRLGAAGTPARVYDPGGRARHTVLLVPGLQPGGINDERFSSLARQLARSGVRVVTPDFAELRQLVMTPALTDRIEAAAYQVATNGALSSDGLVGLMGVSFSAGATLVAASRPRLRPHVRYIFLLGGYDDLPRVLRFQASGDGALESAAPHPYGVAMLMLELTADLVPPDQIEEFRALVRAYVAASYRERVDGRGARDDLDTLREAVQRAEPPSRPLLLLLLDGRVAELGERLRPFIAGHGTAAALSPSQSPPPAGPVYLLHGRRDQLIPASESLALRDRLRGATRVRLLFTDVISHASAEQAPGLKDAIQLARFWGELLTE